MTMTKARNGENSNPTQNKNWLNTKPRLECVMSNSGRSKASGLYL